MADVPATTDTLVDNRPTVLTHDGNGFVFTWGNDLMDLEIGRAYLLSDGKRYYARYKVRRARNKPPYYLPVSARPLTDEEIKYLQTLLEEKF